MRKLLTVIAFLPFVATTAVAQSLAHYRVGAAKIEITPAAADLLPGDTIRDPLYVRAIVVHSANTCAVLVGVDQAGLRGTTAANAIERAAQVTGCAVANFVVSATHTHSGSTRGLFDTSGVPNAQQVENAIVAAVTQANQRLEPARIGFGTAQLDLNVNRDSFSHGQWLQGLNVPGPSDNAMAVIAFVDTQDRPIATYVNYAVKRRSKGTPDRRRRGTPFEDMLRVC